MDSRLWQNVTAQVKAFLRVSTDKDHPLHGKIGHRPASRLKRGSEWMTEATNTIEGCLSVERFIRGNPWPYCDDLQRNYTRVIAILGRECREWNPVETNRAVKTLIEENSHENDAVVFTDGSVKRGEKSGWGYTVRVNDLVLAEGSGAVEITTSSMQMEIKAITDALRWLRQENHRRVVFVTDSVSTL